MSAATILAVLLLYLLFGSTVLRLTTRMVAGVSISFGTALGTIIATVLVSLVVGLIYHTATFGQAGFKIPALVLSIGIQTRVYKFLVKAPNGTDLSFGQAFMIVLFQIPVAFVLGLTIRMALTTGGLTVASLFPSQTHAAATEQFAPEQEAAPSRWANLAAPVSVALKYGTVTYPAGSPVEILDETQTGYRVRVNRAELVVMKNYVILPPR